MLLKHMHEFYMHLAVYNPNDNHPTKLSWVLWCCFSVHKPPHKIHVSEGLTPKQLYSSSPVTTNLKATL